MIPIAGDLKDGGGGNLDAQWTRLSTSPSHADSEKEGLRVELNGGVYNKRKQTAIIELICDKERTGLEGEIDPEDQYESRDEDPAEGSPKAASLIFLKYGPTTDDSDSDVLRLEWRTKYACEGQRDEEGGSRSSHWGFFTWFIIVYVDFQSVLWKFTTDLHLQCLPGNSCVPHFRFLAQLHSFRCSRMGPASSWGHYPRRPLSLQGLVAPGR